MELIKLLLGWALFVMAGLNGTSEIVVLTPEGFYQNVSDTPDTASVTPDMAMHPDFGLQVVWVEHANATTHIYIAMPGYQPGVWHKYPIPGASAATLPTIVVAADSGATDVCYDRITDGERARYCQTRTATGWSVGRRIDVYRQRLFMPLIWYAPPTSN